MKKLLGIVVLGLLFNNNVYSKHLCVDPFKSLEGVTCVDSKAIYNEHTCRCEKAIDTSEFTDEINTKNNKESWFDQFDSSKYDKYIIVPGDIKKNSNTPLKKMSGSKLYCRNESENIYDVGIEFKFMNRVNITQIDVNKEKIMTIRGIYEELSDKIIINYKNHWGDKDEAKIYRKFGDLPRFDVKCALYVGDLSIREIFEKKLNNYVQNQSSKNKF